MINTSVRDLGVSLIAHASKVNVGRYVPTWYIDFLCRWDDPLLENNEWDAEQIKINAIDGTYIEPRIENEVLTKIKRNSSTND